MKPLAGLIVAWIGFELAPLDAYVLIRAPHFAPLYPWGAIVGVVALAAFEIYLGYAIARFSYLIGRTRREARR